MTSKQPMQGPTQSGTAVITSTPAIKDSPAVERALNRSKLYLLVSWSLLYPEEDEFLDYLQCGEFVEDGRAALDALEVALGGVGGDRAKQKLALMRKQGAERPEDRHYEETQRITYRLPGGERHEILVLRLRPG